MKNSINILTATDRAAISIIIMAHN